MEIFKLWKREEREKYIEDFSGGTPIEVIPDKYAYRKDIIPVIVKFDGDVKYEFHYKRIKEKEILEKIRSGESIDFRGRYFERSSIDYSSLSGNSYPSENYDNCYELNSFDASYSFWSSGFLFAGIKFTNQKANFNNSIFMGDEYRFHLVEFAENLMFENIFSGGNDFKFQMCKFTCDYAYFSNTNFGYGEFLFSSNKIDECEVIIQNAISDGVIDINNCKIYKDMILKFCRIKKLQINKCINKSLLQIEGYLNKLSIEGTINQGQLDIDWIKCNVKEAVKNQYKEKNDSGRTLARVFHLLRENYANIGEYEYEDEANICYLTYQEQYESARGDVLNSNSDKSKFTKFFRKIYYDMFGNRSKLIFDPPALFVACIKIVMLFGVLYGIIIMYNQYIFDLSYFLQMNWGEYILDFIISLKDGMYFSGITFLTIGYGDIQPLDYGTFMQALTVLEGFYGVVFMSFFAVSVYRKYTR